MELKHSIVNKVAASQRWGHALKHFEQMFNRNVAFSAERSQLLVSSKFVVRLAPHSISNLKNVFTAYHCHLLKTQISCFTRLNWFVFCPPCSSWGRLNNGDGNANGWNVLPTLLCNRQPTIIQVHCPDHRMASQSVEFTETVLANDYKVPLVYCLLSGNNCATSFLGFWFYPISLHFACTAKLLVMPDWKT